MQPHGRGTGGGDPCPGGGHLSSPEGGGGDGVEQRDPPLPSGLLSYRGPEVAQGGAAKPPRLRFTRWGVPRSCCSAGATARPRPGTVFGVPSAPIRPGPRSPRHRGGRSRARGADPLRYPGLGRVSVPGGLLVALGRSLATRDGAEGCRGAEGLGGSHRGTGTPPGVAWSGWGRADPPPPQGHPPAPLRPRLAGVGSSALPGDTARLTSFFLLFLAEYLSDGAVTAEGRGHLAPSAPESVTPPPPH